MKLKYGALLPTNLRLPTRESFKFYKLNEGFETVFQSIFIKTFRKANNAIFGNEKISGSDINGFGNQADSRGAGSEPVRYPFTLFAGSDWGPQFAAAGIQPLTFYQSQSVEGQRKWNIDEEGFSHYGLIADFVEETRIEGGEEATTALYNSAEQYLRMWERTLAR